MSEHQRPGDEPGEGAEKPGRPALLVTLAVILFLECVLLAGLSVFLLVELFVATPGSYASAIFMLILAIVAATWVGVTAVSTLRGREWIRGAVVVWQLLQIAVAVGSFQGLFARPDVGWLLLAPALAALILLFMPSVIASTTRSRG